MEKTDSDAVKKLATILYSRGVDYDTGLTISLRVRFVTQTMIDWLERNPDASVEEMCQKSRELHKAHKQANWPKSERKPCADEEKLKNARRSLEEALKKDEELRESGELSALMQKSIHSQAPNPSPQELVEAILSLKGQPLPTDTELLREYIPLREDFFEED